YSNFVSYKTPTPVERVNATVSDVRPDGFTVSWEKKECLNFELHLAITPDFEDEIIVSLSNTTTRYSFDSLEPATTYFVYVRSIGFYGEYADSQTISVLTTPEMLDAVAEVEKITISWRAPSPRFFEKTEVYMARDSSNVFDTASLLTVIYEPSISTLTITTGYEEINTAFYFGIIVYNTLWQSAASNVVSNTTFLPQIPRVSLSKYEILNATSVKIYLPATDYAYFSRLEIHLSLEENFTPSERTLVSAIYTQGESTYLLYGLTPDVDYYVKVVLVDVFGQMSISQTLRVRTTATIEVEQPPPQIPFYIYGLLLMIFFFSSIISALCLNAMRVKARGKK
ncbi:MAG: fibronectin type III domain-containing protein, partial [Thermoplasmata archaeon]